MKTLVSGGAVGFTNVAVQGRVRKAAPAQAVRLSPGVFRVFLPRISAAVQAQVIPRRPGAVPSTAPPWFTTTTIKGVPMRLLTLLLPNAKVTVSRSLLEVDRNLSHLQWLLVLISLGGIGAAAILGALVSGRAMAPLRRLTETTERIVETGDLSERTGRRGRDEISRLSTRLDELLASLEASLRTQRQLVADASHELRTPLTTLQANIELLAHPGALEESERAGLLADVQDELEAMTALVGELVELARGEEPDVAPREFRLDEVVQTVVDRTARRAPTLAFRTQLEPSVVIGVPERIERAVSNLLDNARKWSPPAETVEVAVHDGLVEVRDHGPGIAAEDRPLVFNRFYRCQEGARDARCGSRSRDRQADRRRARRQRDRRGRSRRRSPAAAAAFTDSLEARLRCSGDEDLHSGQQADPDQRTGAGSVNDLPSLRAEPRRRELAMCGPTSARSRQKEPFLRGKPSV